MKLIARSNGREVDLEVTAADSRIHAKIDGRVYELEASEPEPGIFLLKYKGRIFETYVSNGLVSLGGQTHEIDITDPRNLRSSGSDGDHSTGHAEIRTAMPGKVVRILKSLGESVEKGEAVIVVEAMKMQNEMRSPKDGIIAEIRSEEGATVGAGDLLVVIE